MALNAIFQNANESDYVAPPPTNERRNFPMKTSLPLLNRNPRQAKNGTLPRVGPGLQGVRRQPGLVRVQARDRECLRQVRPAAQRLGRPEPARFRVRRVRGQTGRRGRVPLAGRTVS